MKLDSCTALITGASAGIGGEFARQLATRARGLVLVARRGQRLEQLREELSARNPCLKVHMRIVDLADRSQVDALIEWLASDKIDIDLLINNAGLGDLGRFASANAGAKTRRDSERELVGRVPADSRVRHLCRDESVREQFYRSIGRGITRHWRERLRALPRASAH